MRIVQLAQNLSATGGVERFIYQLSKRIVQGGHETLVCTLDPAVHEHHWGSESVPSECIMDKADASRRILAEWRPDLVMWHGAPGFADTVMRLVAHVPVVATIHGAFCPSGSRLFRLGDEICFAKSGSNCLWHWYVHRCGYGRSPASALQAVTSHRKVVMALSRCDRIYAVSNSVKRFLEIEGIPPQKVHVFDNTLGGIEPSRNAYVHPLHTGGTLRLLYMGRLVYSKGVHYLIQAVHRMVQDGEDVHLHIGGEGWSEPDLRCLTQELHLGNAVTFHGRIPGTDVQQMYAKADIVVVPSVWPEPAGLVVPEARQQGKPVIVFDSGGLAEWAQLMNGVHVTPRADVESLASTILAVRDMYSSTGSAGNEGEWRSPQCAERIDILDDCVSWLQDRVVSKKSMVWRTEDLR